MVYTNAIKKQMEYVLEAFGTYTRAQDYFDIVCSEKMGYAMLIRMDRKNIVTFPIDTPEEMVKMLFYTIMADVISTFENGGDTNKIVLAESEVKKCRCGIAEMLETLPDGERFSIKWFDQWLKDHSAVERGDSE